MSRANNYLEDTGIFSRTNAKINTCNLEKRLGS